MSSGPYRDSLSAAERDVALLEEARRLLSQRVLWADTGSKRNVVAGALERIQALLLLVEEPVSADVQGVVAKAVFTAHSQIPRPAPVATTCVTVACGAVVSAMVATILSHSTTTELVVSIVVGFYAAALLWFFASTNQSLKEISSRSLSILKRFGSRVYAEAISEDVRLAASETPEHQIDEIDKMVDRFQKRLGTRTRVDAVGILERRGRMRTEELAEGSERSKDQKA